MSTTEIIIRPARFEDWPVIVEFNRSLAEESEGKSLDANVLAEGVKSLLSDAHHGRYFVAEIDGHVVGQLMHTREWSDWRNGEIWWLQSVYVHRDCRRRGVFRRLVRHLTELAKSTPGIVGLRLYMEQANDIARQTYERCGFESGHYVVLEQIWRAETRNSNVETRRKS